MVCFGDFGAPDDCGQCTGWFRRMTEMNGGRVRGSKMNCCVTSFSPILPGTLSKRNIDLTWSLIIEINHLAANVCRDFLCYILF